jgi:hypothetical protein
LHVRAQGCRHRDFERSPDVRQDMPVFSDEHFGCFARTRQNVVLERTTEVFRHEPRL